MTGIMMGMSSTIWTLPEGHDYAIEFFAENKWMRREDYNTISYLKQVISAGIIQVEKVRIVKVSRYPPYPACAIIYYKEEKQ